MKRRLRKCQNVNDFKKPRKIEKKMLLETLIEF